MMTGEIILVATNESFLEAKTRRKISKNEMLE